MTILLADDHRLVRRGIRTLVETERDMHVVAEASDGLEAVAAAAEHRPDVAVVDLAMPGLSGIEVVRQMQQHAPTTRVVVLSMHGSLAYVEESLQSGAYGYVLKDAEARELITAVRRAAAGQRYVCDELSDRSLRSYVGEGETEDPLDTLSVREREVMQLTVEGLTSNEVGIELHISGRTVEKHRANLMKKLGLKSKSELIRYAFERGLRPSVDD